MAGGADVDLYGVKTPSEATGGAPKLSPPTSTIPKLSRSSKVIELYPLQDWY